MYLLKSLLQPALTFNAGLESLHSSRTVAVTRRISPISIVLSHPWMLCTFHTYDHSKDGTPNNQAHTQTVRHSCFKSDCHLTFLSIGLRPPKSVTEQVRYVGLAGRRHYLIR